MLFSCDGAGCGLHTRRWHFLWISRPAFRQVGVYGDCLSSIQGNKVRVERQVARVTRPASRRIENGQPVITWASVEDPSSPDVTHHRIIKATDFIQANSEGGFNEQQVCWSIIVFLFAYWDEEIRPQIAKETSRPMKCGLMP